MLQKIFTKPDSKPTRLLKLLNRKASEIASRSIRFARLEESDSVEGHSRSFRVWMFSSLAALLGILILNLQSNSEESTTGRRASAAVDIMSLVPDGFVLVPLEPLNMDSIDAVFGSRGWADLFVERAGADLDFRQTGRPSRKRIASGVALIRAPRNPSRIAAIVAESDVQLISDLGQPVHVALRKNSPKQRTAELTSNSRISRTKVLPKRPQQNLPLIELVHEDGIKEQIE